MSPKPTLPPRPASNASARFSNLSGFSSEERHILSKISESYEKAQKVKTPDGTVARFVPPALLVPFPKYAQNAFEFIHKYINTTRSRDYGAALLDYLSMKFPNEHGSVRDAARFQMGLPQRPVNVSDLPPTNAPAKASSPRPGTGASEALQPAHLADWYSKPETFLPMTSRKGPVPKPPGGDAPKEKPWYLLPAEGVDFSVFRRRKKRQNADDTQSKGFSKDLRTNSLVDNMRLFFGVAKIPGRNSRGIYNFVRGNPLHMRAAELVRQHNLDLSKPEGVAAFERLIAAENSQKPETQIKSSEDRETRPDADPEAPLREKMECVFTRVVRYHNRTHPSGSMGWVSNLIQKDPAHIKAEGLLRGVALSSKMDVSDPKNEQELTGLMLRHAGKNPEREGEWVRLLARKKKRYDSLQNTPQAYSILFLIVRRLTGMC